MAYFKKAQKGDKIYGLIFGKGKILEVYPDSFYPSIIEFDNGYEVPYTDDGIPSWGHFKKQTMFYRKDVDLSDEDFSPVDEVLSPKEIIKLREKNRLEVRLPSGIWRSSKKADEAYLESILKRELYHLFRKKK